MVPIFDDPLPSEQQLFHSIAVEYINELIMKVESQLNPPSTIPPQQETEMLTDLNNLITDEDLLD